MAGQLSTAGQKLKFLTDQAFEDETALLLAEYGNKRGHVPDRFVDLEEVLRSECELVPLA